MPWKVTGQCLACQKPTCIKDALSVSGFSLFPSISCFLRLVLNSSRFSVPYFIKSKVIAQMFPLHDKRELKALSFDWYKSVFSAQPLGEFISQIGRLWFISYSICDVIWICYYEIMNEQNIE